ncbi:Bug family tripartite tricarboxylate transporter substrate binding protein [Roseomonas marmotae]|uniref:Tripartite tricarboxylate transporter substrate binding protein n=1 Tax=Roseomonas marmotae TaxID=2768161 RepID=A0ABS3KKR3_9PROT|nr:tripartite tricarboxylate transporter substrate binding protein [Roseomonas marmotae]MBO1076926.1 tripartite tricarboxylate transporter substrate binding protein [Roseomonas marmotae]
MSDNRRWHRRALLSLGGAALLPRPADAQGGTSWPERPVRIIIPFGAGAAHDVLVRLAAEQLQSRLGQPFVCENRPGAGGNIGTEAVARAAPDGYTINAATIGTLTINQFLYTRLPYDPVRDFVPSTLLWESANCLFVSAQQNPSTTLAEFITWAKARPGGTTFSSAGAGTTPHLAGELFRLRAGFAATHVPYREGGQRVLDLASGTLDFAVDNVSTYTALLGEGKIRALAVAAATRWPTLPDVPTMAEAGLQGLEVPTWGAFAFPAGTPPPVVEKLAGAMRQLAEDPAMQQRFLRAGGKAVYATPADTAAFAMRERERWQAVVLASGARVD